MVPQLLPHLLAHPACSSPAASAPLLTALCPRWLTAPPHPTPRRDRSCKAFLRRYAAGALPPLTGAADDQANAFTRLPPLVALFAGGGRARLLGAVERMVRWGRARG